MIVNTPQTSNITVYYQVNTGNKSFVDMMHLLSKLGVKNNKFFCILFDPDLYNINPHDPNLSVMMKKKVSYECMRNYWYFIRECVRIPVQGATSGGIPYKLHRGNLALNFCLVRNMNIFFELPRQFGKTMGICVRLLWEFLYGTTNSQSMLINIKHERSKANLQTIKDLRDCLPSFLQLRDNYGSNGGKVKEVDRAEKITNATNNNSIVTMASARNPIQASTLGRGCTQPRQWYDEYAFIPYNNIIYNSATPAFSRASANAKANNAPYGILISTTPGDLTTDAGMDAFATKELATPFSEQWYDFTPNELNELLAKNKDSNFVYIRYTYQQLGAGEEYLARMIKDLKKDWIAIRREVLLEWSEASDNSPFRKEDLDRVKSLTREKIGTMKLCKYYELNVYEPVDFRAYPPIIGVDVSSGYRRDSSAITIIDSKTTRVVADLNCNYIPPNDLASCIIELVTRYAPTAVVNVERNGVGAGVVGKLIDSPIKRNLYYEIKDKIIEERYDGFKVNKTKVKTKVYGLDNTRTTREELIEILRQRMENHKDKFISPILYSELKTLELKKDGKVEHSTNGHDDQVFSYLIALYVWYNGKNVMDTWGITKGELKTDTNENEEIIEIDNSKFETDISASINNNYNGYAPNGEVDILEEQMNFINSNKTYTQTEWYNMQYKQDEYELAKLLSTPVGKRAYQNKYNVTDAEIKNLTMGISDIPVEVFDTFYDNNIEDDDNNLFNPNAI